MGGSSEFQGSFSEGVERDHEGHLRTGSFGDVDCPNCRGLVSAHAAHVQATGSFSEGSRGLKRDEEGHLPMGSFGATDCPICRAEAAKA